MTTIPPDPKQLATALLPALKELPAPAHQLTHRDRCDVRGCGAQAYIRATFAAGPLYFCGHHGRIKALDLITTCTEWLDESGQLSDKRAGL